jgi:outer membrane protein TolC
MDLFYYLAICCALVALVYLIYEYARYAVNERALIRHGRDIADARREVAGTRADVTSARAELSEIRAELVKIRADIQSFVESSKVKKDEN